MNIHFAFTLQVFYRHFPINCFFNWTFLQLFSECVVFHRFFTSFSAVCCDFLYNSYVTDQRNSTTTGGFLFPTSKRLPWSWLSDYLFDQSFINHLRPFLHSIEWSSQGRQSEMSISQDWLPFKKNWITVNKDQIVIEYTLAYSLHVAFLFFMRKII